MTSTRLLFTSGSALLIASWADLISGRLIENPAEMIILSAFLIVPVGLLMLSIETLRATILGAIYLFLSVIGSFASAYRIYGTHANWGHGLSRSDAVYLAMGTFTTAGANGVMAKTDFARRGF